MRQQHDWLHLIGWQGVAGSGSARLFQLPLQQVSVLGLRRGVLLGCRQLRLQALHAGRQRIHRLTLFLQSSAYRTLWCPVLVLHGKACASKDTGTMHQHSLAH